MAAQTATAFQEQMDRLVGTLRPGQTAGEFAVWLGEMDETRAACGVEEDEYAVLRAAVTSLLAAVDEHDQPLRWPIKPLQFRQALRHAITRHRQPPPVLPAPERRAGDEIDPDDPYSCTPEERERWAREDQWIRQWAARLPAAPPPYAPAAEFDAWQRNQSVANWPNLTPAARRAKERRIALERARAMGEIRRVAGHPVEAGDESLAGIPPRPHPEATPEWPVPTPRHEPRERTRPTR